MLKAGSGVGLLAPAARAIVVDRMNGTGARDASLSRCTDDIGGRHGRRRRGRSFCLVGPLRLRRDAVRVLRASAGLCLRSQQRPHVDLQRLDLSTRLQFLSGTSAATCATCERVQRFGAYLLAVWPAWGSRLLGRPCGARATDGLSLHRCNAGGYARSFGTTRRGEATSQSRRGTATTSCWRS